MIARESRIRDIGYGAMVTEMMVALMAMIAACVLEPGEYFAINTKGAPVEVVARISAAGYPVTEAGMQELATNLGESTMFGRAGGAPTFAVGMAHMFARVSSNPTALALWYHFAIMFEALFILTTLDAGTRVGRYILQDFLGNLWKPLGDTKAVGPNLLASGLMVAGWGTFLIQGVRDPLGGINSLWPLFGIANQMLAAIALCLATTILLKMALKEGSRVGGQGSRAKPVLAFITLLPLVWLLSVTFTAGVQKIWHPDPRIGFISGARTERAKLSDLVAEAKSFSDYPKRDEFMRVFPDLEKKCDRIISNLHLDAVVTAFFLALVSLIIVLSLREWFLLLSRRKSAVLHESEPVWLPDYALVEGRKKFGGVAGTVALTLALAKELSGEAQLERAQVAQAHECKCDQLADAPPKTASELYVETTEQRFNGIRRCC